MAPENALTMSAAFSTGTPSRSKERTDLSPARRISAHQSFHPPLVMPREAWRSTTLRGKRDRVVRTFSLPSHLPGAMALAKEAVAEGRPEASTRSLGGDGP